MRLNFCVACGDKDQHHLHQHHLVPKAQGGADVEENFITLCVVCHGKIHSASWSYSHRDLIMLGRAKSGNRTKWDTMPEGTYKRVAGGLGVPKGSLRRGPGGHRCQPRLNG